MTIDSRISQCAIGPSGELAVGALHELAAAVRDLSSAIRLEHAEKGATNVATLREAADDEGDELVCVDQCGSCDACGMEPFGTPTEGWREAARFLRRTARDSGNREGALHGARLIEAELRRRVSEE